MQTEAALPEETAAEVAVAVAVAEVVSQKLRILTVGDGDLSLSRAIVRCYGAEHVELTASTIVPSAAALIQTYPHTAAATLNELESIPGVHVLFGVDACKLHDRFQKLPPRNDMTSSRQNEKPFDLVIFQHPHLGDYGAEEMDLVHRHCRLIAHYLESAKFVASRVHVALCANQAESWRLLPSATRAGLNPVGTSIPVQNPFYQIFPSRAGDPWNNFPDWQSSNYRSDSSSTGCSNLRGKKVRQELSRRQGGSRNWMGRFGYSHVRTMPTKRGSASPMLAGSFHYLFEQSENNNNEKRHTTTDGSFSCSTCDTSFPSSEELLVHLESPAVPLHKEFNQPTIDTTIDCSSSIPCRMFDDEGVVCGVDRADETVPATIDQKSDDEGIRSFHSLEEEDKDGEGFWVVASKDAGKRLRWYLHNVVSGTGPTKKSKREWDRVVKQGRVALNGVIVTDSSRVLQTPGWKIEIGEEPEQDTVSCDATRCEPQLDPASSWSSPAGDMCTVWKPVGMRAIGSFDTSTLEETFSRQQHIRNGIMMKYRCLSKLEKGCSGLCLLQQIQLPNEQHLSNNFEIIHTFTALVHGHAPDQWTSGVTISLAFDGIRRWKRLVDCRDDGGPLPKEEISVRIKCVERTNSVAESNVPALSTLRISTKSTASKLVQTVAYFLRKTANHPIVGDRVAVQEYLSLPRSMRNRIKQRFCIGCTRINVLITDAGQEYEEVSPIPGKWSAWHWRDFLST